MTSSITLTDRAATPLELLFDPVYREHHLTATADFKRRDRLAAAAIVAAVAAVEGPVDAGWILLPAVVVVTGCLVAQGRSARFSRT